MVFYNAFEKKGIPHAEWLCVTKNQLPHYKNTKARVRDLGYYHETQNLSSEGSLFLFTAVTDKQYELCHKYK